MRRKYILVSLLFFTFLTFNSYALEPLAPAETNINFTSKEGAQIQGEIIYPDGVSPDDDVPGGEGKLPGILFIHDELGLNQEAEQLARALAHEGYIVWAPSAFRGSVATTMTEAQKLLKKMPKQRISNDLEAALAYFYTRSNLNSKRVAVVGFGFGGAQALSFGIRHPELAAVISLYGNELATEPAKLDKLKEAGPLLGIYGAKDEYIPVTDVKNFDQLLTAAKVKHTITIYPDAGHGFIRSTNYTKSGAANRAWQQVLLFLKQNLKRKASKK